MLVQGPLSVLRVCVLSESALRLVTCQQCIILVSTPRVTSYEDLVSFSYSFSFVLV